MQALGIPVTGTLGLIEIAKKTHIITRNEALQLLKEIQSTSLYIARDVLEEAQAKIRSQPL